MTELKDWDALPADLALLATQLARFGSTERTADALQTLQRAFENDWRINRRIKCAPSIPVPVPRDKALFPVGCELVDADVQFEFKLGEGFEVGDLPARSEFQVRVSGLVEYAACIVNLQDHWRVDTHDFRGDPREPHAFIHFQRGGHAQDGWAGSRSFVPGPELPHRYDDYWQSLLQSPGPRVPFLPVCPVLVLDFVIGQHDGNVWINLRRETEYREIIARAQSRMWDPFFDSLADPVRRRKWLGSMLL